jgi:hypothetical protein
MLEDEHVCVEVLLSGASPAEPRSVSLPTSLHHPAAHQLIQCREIRRDVAL